MLNLEMNLEFQIYLQFKKKLVKHYENHYFINKTKFIWYEII